MFSNFEWGKLKDNGLYLLIEAKSRWQNNKGVAVIAHNSLIHEERGQTYIGNLKSDLEKYMSKFKIAYMLSLEKSTVPGQCH